MVEHGVMPMQEGVYTIHNVYTGTYLDLSKDANDANVHGWSYQTPKRDGNQFHQRWRVTKSADETFRLQNLSTLTFLDLNNNAVAANVHGYADRSNDPQKLPQQQWFISQDTNFDDIYTVQNRWAKTFVDLSSSKDDANVKAYDNQAGTKNAEHQQWIFKPLTTIDKFDIKTVIFKVNDPFRIDPNLHIQVYAQVLDDEYQVISKKSDIQAAWNDANIHQKRKIFGYAFGPIDLSMQMKADFNWYCATELNWSGVAPTFAVLSNGPYGVNMLIDRRWRVSFYNSGDNRFIDAPLYIRNRDDVLIII